MTKRLQILFTFLLVLTSFSFFGANFLNKSFVNYTTFFSCFIAVLLSVPFVFEKKGGFVLPIQLIVSSILISMFMAYWSWGQGFMVTLVATVPLLLWVFFFYLININIPLKTIETVIFTYASVYLLLYFYQWSHAGTILFGTAGGEDEFGEARGIVRIIFPGGGIFFLAVFIALNKLTTHRSNRFFWILFVVLGVIVPIMQATRQFIAGILIIYLYHFIKNQNVFKKGIIIAAFLATIVYIGQSDIPVVKGLINVQEETVKEGHGDIRVQAGTYFLTEFSPTVVSKVFGNGAPASPDLSAYGAFVNGLYDRGFYMEDVGIIGMYAMFGILAVFGYLIIWFKSFTLKLPNEYFYAKYYLWFLLITSLTSNFVYQPYYLISTVFALYIYQHVYEEQQKMAKIAIFLERSKLESNN